MPLQYGCAMRPANTLGITLQFRPPPPASSQGIDIGKYVASGVAVFDLRTRSEKWVQHLDLSVDSTEYKVRAAARTVPCG